MSLTLTIILGSVPSDPVPLGVDPWSILIVIGGFLCGFLTGVGLAIFLKQWLWRFDQAKPMPLEDWLDLDRGDVE